MAIDVMKKKRLALVTTALITLVTLLIFLSLIKTPYLAWDDDSNIFNNPYFRAGDWSAFWKRPYFGLYVPLISTMWAVLFNVGHGTVWPFRVFNAILQGTNVVLLSLLLNRLGTRWRIVFAPSVSLALGLFAVHPLQVESIAWISGGRDLLSAFFALISILVYTATEASGAVSYTLATLSFVAALLSKPSVAVLPLIILFLDIVICRRSSARSLSRMLPWLCLSLLIAVVTGTAQVEQMPTALWASLPLGERLLRCLATYLFYFQKLIWPLNLSANYGNDLHYAHFGHAYFGRVLLVAFVATIVACFLLFRRDRRFAILGAWPLALLPVSGLIPFAYQEISPVADHYAYLSLATVTPALMVGIDSLWLRAQAWVPTKWAVYGLSLAVLGVWASLSWSRLSVWQSNSNFFVDMSRSAPDSYSAAIGMTVALCLEQNDYSGGVRWSEKALAARPKDIFALANKAACLVKAGQMQDAAAMEPVLHELDIEKLAKISPTPLSSLYASLGTALIETKRLAEGYRWLCSAVRTMPSEPLYARNLQIASRILRQQGMSATCDTQKSEL